MVTVLVTRTWGLSFVTLSTVITTFVVFFAGEMLPKSIGKKYSCKFSLELAPSLLFFMYYSGIYTGNYYLQYSDDGENYTDESTMSQNYAEIYKWQNAKLKEENKSTKYIRIIADSHLEMGELALYDEFGARIPASSLRYNEGVATLFDEQSIVPAAPDYLNSTYFDEVYHVRTAVEHMMIPVVITVYADRSFTFITKTPPTALLVKKA